MESMKCREGYASMESMQCRERCTSIESMQCREGYAKKKRKKRKNLYSNEVHWVSHCVHILIVNNFYMLKYNLAHHYKKVSMLLCLQDKIHIHDWVYFEYAVRKNEEFLI